MAERSLVLSLLGEQRRRLISAVLQHCEQSEWYGELTLVQREELRQTVLEAVGRFYDLVRDLHKVLQDETIQNERSVQLLESIHREVRRGRQPS
jgi:cation transport regulator ChaC